jgi:hypothetical protein
VDTQKCDKIFAAVLNPDNADNYNLFELAQCFIDGYDPQKLRTMLNSKDEAIVLDGLFVLGEIGPLARNYSSEIERLAKSDDPDIRRMAVNLASIYLKGV